MLRVQSKRQTLSGTRKKRKPAKSSLAWYREEWRRAITSVSPDEVVEFLAQVSYENKKLRERMNVVERGITAIALATNHMQKTNQRIVGTMSNITTFLKLNLNDGLVMVGSVPHLQECALAQKKVTKRVVDSHTRCTCGSLGPKESN